MKYTSHDEKIEEEREIIVTKVWAEVWHYIKSWQVK